MMSASNKHLFLCEKKFQAFQSTQDSFYLIYCVLESLNAYYHSMPSS